MAVCTVEESTWHHLHFELPFIMLRRSSDTQQQCARSKCVSQFPQKQLKYQTVCKVSVMRQDPRLGDVAGRGLDVLPRVDCMFCGVHCTSSCTSQAKL